MRIVHITAVLVAATLVGCAQTGGDPLYQPIEPNHAMPGDPIRQQFEDAELLDDRQRLPVGQVEPPAELDGPHLGRPLDLDAPDEREPDPDPSR